MKRGTPRHPKMKRLARLLKIELYAATGIMEMLWHFAGEFTPAGDIGRVSDADIADGVAWRKEPMLLITGLTESGWLDKSHAHRLIVHDWPDHADDAVRKKLTRMRAEFLTEYGLRRDAVAMPSGRSPTLVSDAVGHTSAEGQGKAGQGKARNGQEEILLNRYHEFVEKWPEHNRRGVDCGAQIWGILIDNHEITPANIHEVFQGLERWKLSEQWVKEGGKFIPVIADPEKHGWLQKRAWKDAPKPATKEDW